MHPARTTGYVSKVGVRRESLWAWARRYLEFADAFGVARAIQEALWIGLGPDSRRRFMMAEARLRSIWSSGRKG